MMFGSNAERAKDLAYRDGRSGYSFVEMQNWALVCCAVLSMLMVQHNFYLLSQSIFHSSFRFHLAIDILVFVVIFPLPSNPDPFTLSSDIL